MHLKSSTILIQAEKGESHENSRLYLCSKIPAWLNDRTSADIV